MSKEIQRKLTPALLSSLLLFNNDKTDDVEAVDVRRSRGEQFFVFPAEELF